MIYNSKLATENYARVLVLIIGCWLLTTYVGDSPSVIFLKVLLVPFFFVAKSGVSSFFKAPIVESRFSVRAVEYYVLIGIFDALMVTIIFWKPEMSTMELLKILGFAILLFTFMQLFQLTRDVYKLKNVGSLENR